MKFSEYINEKCPSFEDKLNAALSEIQASGEVVEIDFRASDISKGKNTGANVVATTRESQGRCHVYVNEKKYDGMIFPHVVFLNFRQQFQDRARNKTTPAVCDVLSVLFELYKDRVDQFPILKDEVKLCEKKVICRDTLINEQRQWFRKLKPIGSNIISHFKDCGIKQKVLKHQSLNARTGFSSRYGRFHGFPLRYVFDDTFQGFTRIYENGFKAQVEGFNPNDLCVFFGSHDDCYDVKNVDLIIKQEGCANSLLLAQMANELGYRVLVIACMYASNMPNIGRQLSECSLGNTPVLNLYDNDTNGVGKRYAEMCDWQKLDCFSRNDIRDMVKTYSYDYAKNQFAQILTKHAEK